jgi:large subunit ribosomal protein L29e
MFKAHQRSPVFQSFSTTKAYKQGRLRTIFFLWHSNFYKGSSELGFGLIASLSAPEPHQLFVSGLHIHFTINTPFFSYINRSCCLCKTDYQLFLFWVAEMAKSKNHTAHNQSHKAHQNGIKKPKRHRHTSTKGVLFLSFLWICYVCFFSPLYCFVNWSFVCRWTPSFWGTRGTQGSITRSVMRQPPRKSRILAF